MPNHADFPPPYIHTQRAGRVVHLALAIGVVGVLAAVVAGGIAGPHTRPAGYGVTALVSVTLPIVVAVVAIITLIQFSSLTIQVDSTALTWWFGPAGLHLIRKSVPLSEIDTVAVVRNPLWYGWGIHLTLRGWLYNIGGRDGIEVTLRSGKRFRLGTDEPNTLAQAIQQRAPA
jgi:hypothetical protein